jgi:hypothetical protein
MGEELFTLMFILIIIAASVLDAAGRRKAKKRRMEEMEREEAEEASGTRRPQERTEGPRVRRSPEPSAAESTSASSGEGERETAETMVPEDLWAILTGQQPSQSQREKAPAESSPQEPPREPHIPMPAPQDRMSTGTLEGTGSAPASEEERPTRRSARWMEGKKGRGESERWGATTARMEAESREAMEEPWDELEDIAAGDITAAEGEVQAEEVGGRLQPARRRGVGGRGRYTQLLQSGDIEDLRKAVVLREILDRPVAFRERVGPDW